MTWVGCNVGSLMYTRRPDRRPLGLGGAWVWDFDGLTVGTFRFGDMSSENAFRLLDGFSGALFCSAPSLVSVEAMMEDVGPLHRRTSYQHTAILIRPLTELAIHEVCSRISKFCCVTSAYMFYFEVPYLESLIKMTSTSLAHRSLFSSSPTSILFSGRHRLLAFLALICRSPTSL